MKIVLITDTYPPNVNGAALAAERLAQELVKRQHSVFVIAPSTSLKKQKTQQGNLTIYRVPSIPILIEKVQAFRISPKPLHDKDIRTFVKEVKPDILHINEPWLMGLTALKIGKKVGIPVVATHHFMPENLVHYLHLPPKIEDVVEKAIWNWYVKLCRNFNVVICPSETAANLIRKYSSSVNLKVISNGIDLKTFHPNNKGSSLRKEFEIPKNPIILFVGRLDKEKHIDVLIRAAALLKEKRTFHIIIVGQGKEKTPLKKFAANLGIAERVTFTGYLAKKDLPHMYSLADIFVMPGIAELQSLATMEAMASGLPIVAADAVALPHLVHTDKNGFLFAPGDEKDLSEKLFHLLTNKILRQKMGKKSLAMIQKHDIQKVVREVESTYKNVL